MIDLIHYTKFRRSVCAAKNGRVDMKRNMSDETIEELSEELRELLADELDFLEEEK